ncbi:MAG: YraN family protein [Synergistaceae bacterium]
MSLERALSESIQDSIPRAFCNHKPLSFNSDIPEHLKLGIFGENLAEKFLQDNGYKIIDRNKRYKTGEIDIIALIDNEIVFAEVRTRSVNSLMPSDKTIGPLKFKKMQHAAQIWIESNCYDGFCRIDLIAITIYQDNSHRIEHIKGITEVMQ